MTVNIAKMLDRERYEVVFCIVGRGEHKISAFIPDTCRTITLPVRSIADFFTIRLTRLLKKESADIVFCSQMAYHPALIVAAKLCRAKVVIRNNFSMAGHSKILRMLYRLTYRYADVVIAQQDEMRDEILSLPHMDPEKVITLHNPVDTELIDEKLACAASPYAGDTVNYVSVGSIQYRKGQDTLLKAFSEVCKRIEDSHLYFVGGLLEPEFGQSLNRYISENGLEKCVHFTGMQSNPYPWMKFADCFVLASRNEGLPNVLIDASYLGTPAVAVRCIPVIERIISDGENGYVVQPEDVSGMAEAMLKALSLRDCRMTFKTASKDDFRRIFDTL